MRLPRASGILLHPTSLPGRFGIGDLGPEAEAFVGLLAETGQRWWQVLPLGPTGDGNSPYQSHSSFAGNPLLISPERLAEDGWLEPGDWADYPRLPEGRVDYDAVAGAKEGLLRRAFARARGDDEAFRAFVEANASWIHDYALYMAVKGAHDGRSWFDWEPELATRRPEALGRWRAELAEEVRYYQFVEFLFANQWHRLRTLCRERDIHLIGDLPIFVALDSADVWARPDLFHLDERARPTVVAGVPPDYFSATGQLWGNPLYRWEAHAAEEYAWWISRLRASLERVDLVRLDHFRGFEAYWEVPAGAETAVGGRWVPGPGVAFFDAVRRDLGRLPLIAEDLGLITPGVEALRDQLELPGMRVLQFAFGDDAYPSTHLPHRYVPHCLAYTGTHDNDTTVGWFRGSAGHTTQAEAYKAAEREFVLRYLGTDGSQVHWDFIRLAMASVADTAILPLQDLLGAGGEARMNVPGEPEGNWAWRFPPDAVTPEIRARLADLTAVYNRWNGALPDALHRCPPRSIREAPTEEPAAGGAGEKPQGEMAA